MSNKRLLEYEIGIELSDNFRSSVAWVLSIFISSGIRATLTVEGKLEVYNPEIGSRRFNRR
jgi:hypothetical protein